MVFSKATSSNGAERPGDGRGSMAGSMAAVRWRARWPGLASSKAEKRIAAREPGKGQPRGSSQAGIRRGCLRLRGRKRNAAVASRPRGTLHGRTREGPCQALNDAAWDHLRPGRRRDGGSLTSHEALALAKTGDALCLFGTALGTSPWRSRRGPRGGQVPRHTSWDGIGRCPRAGRGGAAPPSYSRSLAGPQKGSRPRS